jgi:hypothetical protein
VVVVVVEVDVAPDLAGFAVVVVVGFVLVVVEADEHGALPVPSAWAPDPTPPAFELVPAPEPL